MKQSSRHLEMSAADLYDSVLQYRESYEQRAEDASALTIPTLIPETVSRMGSRNIARPQQGLGARGVNFLSARMMMALLPANQSFFRYMVDPQYKDELSSEEDQAKVEKFLKEREDAIHLEIVKSKIRAKMAESLKHLIVGGNVCYFFGQDGFQYFPLKRFVVERDSDSTDWKFIVVKETVSILSLPDELRALAKNSGAGVNDQEGVGAGEARDEVDIYTKVWQDEKRVYWQQEFNNSGFALPGSFSQVPRERNPWQPVAWVTVEGESYGRSHVEDVMPDLVNFEALTQSLVHGAIGAARLIGLANPNGQTMPEDINNADNGEIISGRREDVDFLQVDKFADFRTAENASLRIESRIKDHFLIRDTRNSERTTALEVSEDIRELDSAFAGQHSHLAQHLQNPLVVTTEFALERRGDLPKIPKEVRDHITPVVVTGIEALGRAADLQRFQQASQILQGILTPEIFASLTNAGAAVDYVFTNAGLSIEGLMKTEEQLAQEQAAAREQELQQTLLQQGTGPAINALASGQGEPPQAPA